MFDRARRQLHWITCALALSRGAYAAPAVVEHPHVRLEVALGSHVSDDGLGYFVAEITRSLGEGLRRGGVIVASTGDPVSVTIDELHGDRVLLSAKARGNRAELEGSVESMDSLVDELAARLVPMCAPSSEKHVATTKPEPQKPAQQKVELARVEPSKPEPPKPAPPEPPKPETKIDPPQVVQAMAPPEPKPVAKPEPKTDPYGPDARVGEAPALDRNRVVVHTLPDPPLDAPQGTGAIATEALYAVLQHRLHLSIVPLGSGITTTAVASEEGQRARARSVVMGRLDSFSYYVGAEGPVARMRFELSIVADGHVVLRRVLVAETPPGAVAAGIAQGRRGRLIDPVYLALTRALDSQLAELQSAIFGNAPR